MAICRQNKLHNNSKSYYELVHRRVKQELKQEQQQKQERSRAGAGAAAGADCIELHFSLALGMHRKL